MRIPFKKKTGGSDNGKEEDINGENFRPNNDAKSNTNASEKNIHSNNSESYYQICFMCKKIISGESKKPEWRWNLDNAQPMCIECYERKSMEYEKITNYCNGCNKKLGFVRYNPKPLWGIKGQLCRSCWDLKNSTFKK